MLAHTHTALDWCNPVIVAALIGAAAAVCVALINGASSVANTIVTAWFDRWKRRRKRSNPPKKKPKTPVQKQGKRRVRKRR